MSPKQSLSSQRRITALGDSRPLRNLAHGCLQWGLGIGVEPRLFDTIAVRSTVHSVYSGRSRDFARKILECLFRVSGGNYSSLFAAGCYAKLSGPQFFFLVNFSVRPLAVIGFAQILIHLQYKTACDHQSRGTEPDSSCYCKLAKSRGGGNITWKRLPSRQGSSASWARR